jgi:CubicO group peptidase (beta-lactamase class C family)
MILLLLLSLTQNIERDVRAGLGNTYPGAVVLVTDRGRIVMHEAYGDAVHYNGQIVPMRKDTLFDLASLSKLFTSIAIMQLVEQGKVDLDAPVARYLPEFGKPDIHVRHLLAHTSGLPAYVKLWELYPTREARIAAVMAEKPKSLPGAKYVYSDLGLITVGLIVEKVSGEPLDRYVAEHITSPLAMKDTMYRPPELLRSRIAATEDEPGRGLCWGSVHDENAWSLGGVAGHAGVFSTAADLAILAQTIIDGGEPILKPETLRAMEQNQNPGIRDGARGLGFDLDAPHFMGALAGPHTIGHTGFTGTSIVIDLDARTFLIFLTNTVHPKRGNKLNPMRVTIADEVARADPQRMAWHAAPYAGAVCAIAAALLILRRLKTSAANGSRRPAGRSSRVAPR